MPTDVMLEEWPRVLHLAVNTKLIEELGGNLSIDNFRVCPPTKPNLLIVPLPCDYGI